MNLAVEWKRKDNLVEYSESEMKGVVSELLTNDNANEQIWFLEHYPVYTAGTSANPSELVNPNKFPVVEVGRGGKYTYHGPGQRIVYLMLNLKKRNLCDLKKYVYMLEETIIDILKEIKIAGFRKKDYIGVWVNHGSHAKKIAAIGIRVSKWMTYHGLAFNINPDLTHYSGIVPCGIQDFGVTSLKELGLEISNLEFDDYFKKSFEKVFLSKG